MGEEGSKIVSNLLGRKIRKFINVFDRQQRQLLFWEMGKGRKDGGEVNGRFSGEPARVYVRVRQTARKKERKQAREKDEDGAISTSYGLTCHKQKSGVFLPHPPSLEGTGGILKIR